MEMLLLPNSKSIYTDWHKMFPAGGKGKQYPYLLHKIVQRNKKTEQARGPTKGYGEWHSILDYGCGKGGTARWLRSLIKNIDIDCYDPGHPEYKHTPLKEQYDLVYSCDVLEHIERDDVDDFVKHTQSLAPYNIHIIDLTPAKKLLPTGRNAHVTLLTTQEWQTVFDLSVEHTIEEMHTYSVADPNYNTRDRLCILTKRW